MVATETERPVAKLTPPELHDRAGRQTRAWHDDVPPTAYGNAGVSNAAQRVTAALNDLKYWATVWTALHDSVRFYKTYSLRPIVVGTDFAITHDHATRAYRLWQSRMRDLRRATERAH